MSVGDFLILINTGRPSPLRVAPFPMHRALNCVRVEKPSWAQASRKARIHFSLCSWLWVGSSCLDFPKVMDNDLKLWAKTIPFSLKLLSVWVFYHSKSSETCSQCGANHKVCCHDESFFLASPTFPAFSTLCISSQGDNLWKTLPKTYNVGGNQNDWGWGEWARAKLTQTSKWDKELSY